MTTKVKICGVTNEEDARWAVNLGAHYVGINFYSQSPRKVSPEMAAKIVKAVPSFVPCVGVFVDHPVDGILKVVQKTGLMGIQLHGDMYTPGDCRWIRENLDESVLLIKVFRVAGENDLEGMVLYRDLVTYCLLDARVEGTVGGTGQTFPWDLAVKAQAGGVKIFLAGGLTPENVGDAVRHVQPFAVDVASGVEKSPKRKDYEKMKKFMEKVKG
jgi:phosphoribosylanthranilate isomerase